MLKKKSYQINLGCLIINRNEDVNKDSGDMSKGVINQRKRLLRAKQGNLSIIRIIIMNLSINMFKAMSSKEY